MDLTRTVITAGGADRLSSTLFVAVLAHGIVILGVTFAPIPPIETNATPALNVTLLVDTADLDQLPTEADLLSSRNQAGGGDDSSHRPTRTLTADHRLSQTGQPLGADLEDADPLEAATPVEQIVSRGDSEREIEAVPETTDKPAPVPMTAAALLQQSAPETLAAELDDRVRNASNEDGPVAAPSTRESVVAAYMVGWRQRVERIGTANFPADFLQAGANAGRPDIEVAIDASGGLKDSVLRRSSGDPRLDQAALEILRLAAPFEPLPDAILAEYDVLRFSYEWDFSTGAR
jgi:protein TonB